MLIKEGDESNVDERKDGYERYTLVDERLKKLSFDARAVDTRAKAPAPHIQHNYLVSILRLMFTVGRVSNWLTVLVSLLRPWYCA